MKNKEFILCAALWFNNTIVCGYRHSNCYEIIKSLIPNINDNELPGRENQGFLTSLNRYVNRSEGFIIAKTNNQIIHNFYNENEGILTSEDLY